MSLLALEAGLTAAAILVALFAPSVGSRWFERIERFGKTLARRPRIAFAIAAGLPLAIRLVLLPLWGFPIPGVHDEFGYLLTADTFVHGRATNPPHPMWRHFESPNILQQPTYASVYPVAQSLFLAVGRCVFHYDWFGVWLSVGLLSGVLFWALAGWLPPSWALFGALLLGLRFGVAGYWMNSYWGGAPAALGGALALGALPRILLRHATLLHAGLLAVGLVLLANSRPYEGFVLALPVAAVLSVFVCRRRGDRRAWRMLVLPAAAVLVCGGAAMGYYSWRVTGSPVRTPYQLSRAQYGFPLIFLWDSPRPGYFGDHEPIRGYYAWLSSLHDRARTPAGLAAMLLAKARVVWWFYLWPLLTVPLIMLPRVVRDRRVRFLLVVLAATAVGLLAEAWTFPHYAAPATIAIVAVLVQCIRHLRQWRPAGLFLSRAIPVLVVVMLAAAIAARPASGTWLQAWCTPMSGLMDRERVADALRARGGRHLVIVRYGPRHDPQNEWVYNGAAIDRARIAWAHDLGPERDAELIRYFAGRTVWLVEDNGPRASLRPYHEVVVAARR